MNYSDFIKEGEQPARNPRETHCFPIATFEYLDEELKFIRWLANVNVKNFYDQWQGKFAMLGEDRVPTAEAREKLTELLFVQLKNYVMSLPWDKDQKLPNLTCSKAMTKFKKHIIWMPNPLNEETVEKAIYMLLNEPKQQKPGPTFDEAIEWFRHTDESFFK